MAKFLVLLLHNLLFPFALLFMAPAALRKMKARGGKISGLWQRFGFFNREQKAKIAEFQRHGQIIWIHAVSVGEVGIAAKFIHELLKQRPESRIVLTTTTPTGLAQAEELAKSTAHHVLPLYSALDGWFIVRRFLRLIRPQQLIFVESEVWPNLVFACTRKRIPTALINARLSPRSERRYHKVLPVARAIFSMLDRAYVQEKEDVARWAKLGVNPAGIECTGSIKYDTGNHAEPVEQIAQFRELLATLNWQSEDPILLVASTHAGEEREMGKVFRELLLKTPNLRLMVAPRHVERSYEVEQDLQFNGLNVVRRRALELNKNVAGSCNVLLIDTTGELKNWQYLATIVIIGKSFLTVGGQNPAEAVVAGKPVVFGPHMENFEALLRLLMGKGGAVQVENFEALQTSLAHLLEHPEEAQKIAKAGREALAVHEGATVRTVGRILGK